MRMSYLKASVLTLVIAGLCGPALAGPSTSSTANGAVSSTHHAAAIPAALRPALYQAMAMDAGPAYDINKNGCATLPREKLTACFTGNGVRFTLLAGQAGGAAAPLALYLVAWGRLPSEQDKGGKLTEVKPVKPAIKGNEASYAHGDLTEWWHVLPMGFEQGFTIAKRPGGQGELTLALAANGRATQQQGTLGWGKMRYGDLVVTDAKGKVIPATLKTEGDRILISVNDAHAAYPLTVDPLVWLEQEVTSNFMGIGEEFGTSVAFTQRSAI